MVMILNIQKSEIGCIPDGPCRVVKDCLNFTIF